MTDDVYYVYASKDVYYIIALIMVIIELIV